MRGIATVFDATRGFDENGGNRHASNPTRSAERGVTH